MDLYDRIDILLKERHLNKKKLCEATGISYNTLSSLFKRRSKNMDIDTIRKIAEVLETSVEYLVTGKINVTNSPKNTVVVFDYNGNKYEFILTNKQTEAVLTLLENM